MIRIKFENGKLIKIGDFSDFPIGKEFTIGEYKITIHNEYLFTAWSERYYSDGTYEIDVTFDAKSGIITTEILLIYSDAADLISSKKRRMPKGKLNGEFGLPYGYMTHRVAKWFDPEWEELKKELKVKSITVYDDNEPFDTTIRCRSEYSGAGTAYHSFDTDGEVEETLDDDSVTKEWQQAYPNTCAWRNTREYKITGATILRELIKTTDNDYIERLYTIYKTPDEIRAAFRKTCGYN